MTDQQDERTELTEALAEQRKTLLRTVRDISEVDANRRTTVSDLTLAGIIKHVNRMEHGWTRVLDTKDFNELLRINADFQEQYYLNDDETLAGLLTEYTETVQRTEKVVAGLPTLDIRIDLPLPMWDPSTTWSARQILVWMLRETAHHCGHADIIRESLNGATTMKM